jgi:hypothetical protein
MPSLKAFSATLHCFAQYFLLSYLQRGRGNFSGNVLIKNGAIIEPCPVFIGILCWFPSRKGFFAIVSSAKNLPDIPLQSVLERAMTEAVFAQEQRRKNNELKSK